MTHRLCDNEIPPSSLRAGVTDLQEPGQPRARRHLKTSPRVGGDEPGSREQEKKEQAMLTSQPQT